ncbi:STAS domain-containing protein [Roseiconus lacunae]|uniref:STAS domain-containing protein n=1 Tax=Roseiconus lacunae TaxID=2605694 RepID=UPI001E467658|nr:STAS domain-containing protein [Roseiconus lacunae]MCD0461783.1 STAS domain-containing protein [Roseiconus lacunae]
MQRIEKHGTVHVIVNDGPIRMETSVSIEELFERSMIGHTPAVVVDLSGVPLIDGSGLEWLVELSERSCRRGGCVRLCGVSELCADVLRVTGVGSKIESFPDLTSALGSFA